MTHRRLRIFTGTLTIAVLALWLLSASCLVSVSHVANRTYNLALDKGFVSFFGSSEPSLPGWYFASWRQTDFHLIPSEGPLAGLHVNMDPALRIFIYVQIPLWIPGTACLLLCLLVGRLTRRTGRGGAFPVLPATASYTRP